MIEITDEEISLEQMIQRARSSQAGAVVSFLGTVRDDGILGMEVEAFRDAALSELEAIRQEAMSRFSLTAAEVVHRTGRLEVGEAIVAIVCSAAHREEAFSGCRYILEELKSRAPLWKKEISVDGGRWVEGK
ncbi:MAG TPA: molybdenum cofactor biosynthesis protein MoaE [Methanothrix sp.]|nr:molybdenum cofactor biosynthesis protein MoaE [Methanothrix sp.]